MQLYLIDTMQPEIVFWPLKPILDSDLEFINIFMANNCPLMTQEYILVNLL
jgi:hypothetical protein